MKHEVQLELVGDDEPRTARSGKEINALACVKLRSDVMPVVAVAVGTVSKEVADLFNARPSHIADAVRLERAFDLEWLVALLLAVPEEQKRKILAELCNVAGYKAPERRSKLTPEQYIEARKRAEKKYLAPAVIELIDRETEES